MKPIRLVLFSLLFTACAGPRVNVSHFFIRTSDEEYRYQALNSIYLLIKKPAVDTSGSHAWVADWAGTLSDELAASDGGVLAYRTVGGFEAPDPFTADINPSGILDVEMKNPTITNAVEKVKRHIDAGRDKGKEYVVERLSADCVIEARIVFRSYPDNKQLLDKKITVSADETKEGETVSFNDNDADRLIVAARGNLAAAVARELISTNVSLRRRKLYVDKKDADSKRAAKLFSDKKKMEAEAIWKSRVDSGTGTWRDTWNVAALAESRRDFERARMLYASVQEKARSEDPAAGKDFDQVFADLDGTYTKRQKPRQRTSPWFEAPIAVMPLSDEVVSLAGPDIVREQIQLLLKEGGYNVVPLNQIDNALRENGFSDAGQFGATTRKKLAQWAGTDRILMGHITHYDEINVGVYQSRTVAGNLLIWSKSADKEIWTAEKNVSTKKVSEKGSNILTDFLTGIGSALIERLAKTPLGPEAREYATLSLESLPRKPK